MINVATYQEVHDLLERTPAASVAWVDGIVAARLSTIAVMRLLDTMAGDIDSALRSNEESVLNDEIRRLKIARGVGFDSGALASKFTIRIRAVLSPSEQMRIMRIVGDFCQPTFETKDRFSKNGHAVMNAVRRVLTGYCNMKVPKGASIVEVGPDVTNWMLSPSPSVWSGGRVGAYQAARPIITPRDSIRMLWADMAANMIRAREAFYSDDEIEKARIFTEMRDLIFPDVKLPSGKVAGEYMLSYDSNYDIKFSDMPVAMAMAGARAWHGTMVRVKGLTLSTRLTQGSLPLMGVNYRVDWSAGRIDFRHPECNAFGYSHDVFEYMKYESRNGYVWSTRDCDYVYSKGPETTDELLFFSVMRVPKLHRMYEPRFTENPRSGMVKLKSLWGVGDEKDGLPRRFEHVEFHVDALNFSKVLEKRRALDHRGDIAVALSLVRSTNVRFYMHGTPIGVNDRIAARLAPATAIVVETMVHEQRLRDNGLFEMAMYQFDLSVASSSWLSRLLTGIIDYGVITGTVLAPIAKMWQDVRGRVVDAVIGSIRDVQVGASIVPQHVVLPREDGEVIDIARQLGRASECACGEIAEIRAALCCADEAQAAVLMPYLQDRMESNDCTLCHEPDVIDSSIDGSTSGSADASDDGVHADDTDNISISEVDSHEDENECERRAFDEFIKLESYMLNANLVECRVDYAHILQSGPISDAHVANATTHRTRHAFLEFAGGRCIRVIGAQGTYGAMFSFEKDEILPIRVVGDAMRADVKNGLYYSCNRMEVWTAPALIEAVEYASVYGRFKTDRAHYAVTLGVPGAGKTYSMMERLARQFKCSKVLSFTVLAVTNESAKAAIAYGEKFGIDAELLRARVMTLDKYLMHKKFPSDILCVDEFPMVHIAKVDAAVAISSATDVRLYGDARQIPYDSFCREFPVHYATLGSSVKEQQITFMPISHRLSRDTCAMWVDQYPVIYPCDCCNLDTKSRATLSYEVVNDVQHVVHDSTVRYHTYLRDDRDELKDHLGLRESKEELRARRQGGLATVHEDQGSTHEHVVTVRLTADYDKNASKRNPSLFNRERYVLTDTTRHTGSYKYITISEEYDLVMKRIDMSREQNRLQAVDDRVRNADVSVVSMLY